MTTFTAPPDLANLTLHSGDFLNVLQGGATADITVMSGAGLNVAGGTALETVLEGGAEGKRPFPKSTQF